MGILTDFDDFPCSAFLQSRRKQPAFASTESLSEKASMAQLVNSFQVRLREALTFEDQNADSMDEDGDEQEGE